MSDCLFHANLAAVYIALAVEAWRINHRRFALYYAVAASITLVFAVVKLPWTGRIAAAMWA